MMESIEKLRDELRICEITGSRPTIAFVAQCADEIEREVAERYMLLPVDADGVPIRCGDEVTADTLGNGKWSVFAVASDYWVDVDGYTHNPYATHHVNPRTIEDVLRDLVDGIGSVDFDALTAIGEAADEIRELMEVD